MIVDEDHGDDDDENLGMEWWHMKAQTETPNTAGMLLGWASFGSPVGDNNITVGKYENVGDDDDGDDDDDDDDDHCANRVFVSDPQV